ncbi:HAD family phosphatase [Corticibacter populi]|uniref:HAD family phosphatase n=1 Tax=Corticibacter populi TaxID=1550736 RepID=A0A3M6QPN1_9BURK|nr:HAD family phosphatase [Corticibacter populi]RMX05024.1 HAD family phosphatase [Corticibacter populi]RZS33540.1 HAD superfamily hydrolase (TIGR01509 family) [Corticibacter populi]
MRFEAVLFDCDGVLVDSEPITNRVLRQMLEEAGWTLSFEECFAIFLGKAVRDERARIEAHTGRPLTEDWMAEFYARRNEQLQAELLAEPGALDAVAHVSGRFGQRIACASGADRIKLGLQLRKVGLWDYFDGRIFSGQEMPRNKPSPDVYLAAAGGLQVAPERCVVVEDSVPGIRAGAAAGATVIAYAHTPGREEALLQAGARSIIRHMQELPARIEALAAA